MTVLFFLGGFWVWLVFLLIIKSKEKAMAPNGMPFNEWMPRYLVALVIVVMPGIL